MILLITQVKNALACKASNNWMQSAFTVLQSLYTTHTMMRRTSTLALSQECKRVNFDRKICLYAWDVRDAQQTQTTPYAPRPLYNTMISGMRMQNDTRSRAPISDKQLIGVTRTSMPSDKNHMTWIFPPTSTILTPAGNEACSDYKTDTRIPTLLTRIT